MPSYSLLTSIHIKDFQSISDATIELGRLTVLVGAGDVGKSSILRALRAACLNDASDDDIRHGQKKVEVTLTFEDGVTIEWWKQKGQGGCYRTTSKRTEPIEYTKTGGAVPEAITEYLGIGTIEVDATTELTPQLSDQHDLPFILWETGSRRARILGKATRLDVPISAQMLCKKELDQTRRGAEDATTALADVEERLAALPNYEALGSRLDETEANLKTIDDNLRLVRRARELADQIAEVRSRATAVDVAPLRARLDDAAEALEVAERAQFLGRRIPELNNTLTGLTERAADHQEALESFQTQLDTACEESGVCVVCGGLLTHEECAS
jgi:DNA repair exonuclease SbcCD ATPase subunit